MMDIDQSQRRDIDNIQNDKISLTIDDYNIIDSPFNKNLYDFMVDGYNWIRNDNRIFKYNLVENDKLVFHIDKINELFEKIITNIKISFEIENGNNNFIFNGVNLVHDDIIKSKTFNEFMNKREMVFDCGTFNYSDLDFIVNGKEFDIELLFNGNKSNSMFSLKNVYIIFEFVDKLTNESDTVVNRLEPQIDFYRDENGDLILQIGDDASGKGIDRSEVLNFNDIYPVGSIYMSVVNTSPSVLFGGTWEQIKDTFLLATGDTYANGSTGGEATHTLTENEMPTHTHIQDTHNHTLNAHNHTQNPHSHTIGSLARYNISGKGVAAVGDGYGNSNNYKTGNTTATNKEATATNNPQTATNQNTGGGQAHNNMPPYLVVNIWKRTA